MAFDKTQHERRAAVLQSITDTDRGNTPARIRAANDVAERLAAWFLGNVPTDGAAIFANGSSQAWSGGGYASRERATALPMRHNYVTSEHRATVRRAAPRSLAAISSHLLAHGHISGERVARVMRAYGSSPTV